MNAEFVDTNVILYSLSDDGAKRRRALAILVDRPVLSLQVLNEAANVMRRKLGFAIPAIREVVLRWMGESRLHPLAPFCSRNSRIGCWCMAIPIPPWRGR